MPALYMSAGLMVVWISDQMESRYYCSLYSSLYFWYASVRDLARIEYPAIMNSYMLICNDV